MYHLNIEKRQFDLAKTLASGQVFRYYRSNEKEFILVTKLEYVIVRETERGYSFSCDEEEYHRIWKVYLDLDRDYLDLQERIRLIDSRLIPILEENVGVRIMRQDPFEILLSFIISQSKSIIQIKKMVEDLSVKFGNHLTRYEGIDIYAFPTAEQLAQLSEQDYRDLRFGYRASYLEDAVRRVQQKELDLMVLQERNDEEIREALQGIRGVGNKVAACVMLFGFGRYGAFPIDTWMRKIMLHLYYEQEFETSSIKDRELEKKGRQLFGPYAGFAQQYLFEYARLYL